MLATSVKKAQVSWRDYFELCKPKVVGLMLITVFVGMFLSTQKSLPLELIIITLVGVACCAGAAAAINHVVERHSDQFMSRTQRRPLPTGKISPQQALLFAGVLTAVGMFLLFAFVNGLTAILTFATLIAYAVVYTLFLKKSTSQNIVIGGIAGATPPLLGWTAVTGHLDPYALLPVLIIFTWTPPHFWALAIFRYEDYKKADLPMLPVEYGIPYTKKVILLYTVLLIVTSVLPYATGMSGWLYLMGALLLGGGYLYWNILLLKSEERMVAMQSFRYSIGYLGVLFFFLLLDHVLIMG
jgi:heme o synthase